MRNKSRYILKKQGSGYVIIDKFPEWSAGKQEIVIERFAEDEFDLAVETLGIYIDEEKKSRQRDRKEKK